MYVATGTPDMKGKCQETGSWLIVIYRMAVYNRNR